MVAENGARTDGEACVHGARVRGFPRHLILFFIAVHYEATEWGARVWTAIIGPCLVSEKLLILVF